MQRYILCRLQRLIVTERVTLNMFNITCYVTMLLGLTNLLWKFQINKVYSECLTRRAAGGTRRAAREPEVFSAPLVSTGRADQV